MVPSDSASVNLRLQRLLTTADLESPDLPAAAILIVRRLADPLPGGLAAGDAIRPSQVWERTAQAALADCFDRAARPADGPVPASANAVCFDDEAELLACLAQDLLAGDAPGRWWWRAFFREASRSALEFVVSAWLERPRAIAAALGMLASSGQAVGFVDVLSPRQARALFVALADACALPALLSTPVGVVRIDARLAAAGSPGTRRVDSSTPAGVDSAAEARVAPPPWQALIQPSLVPATLELERQTLLGVGLAVCRAPLAIRTSAFQEAFHGWRQRVQETSSPPRQAIEPHAIDDDPRDTISSAFRDDGSRIAASAPSRRVQRPGETAPTPRDAGEAFGTTGEPAVTVETPGHAPESPATSIERVAQSPGESPRDQRAAPSSHITTPVPTGSADHALERLPRLQRHRDAAGIVGPSAAAAPVRADLPVASAPRRAPTAVHTQLGGVLFLVNAMTARDGDMAWQTLADAAAALQIGGWSWLAIVARRLLGDRPDVDDDPIWATLRELDGNRESGGVSAATSVDRAAADAAPILETILPALRQRLLSALGFEPRSSDEERALLATRVLFRRGRLACTSTHVDLHMSMDQVDIAVRLAGLDANPGWVPALGRVVTFHFE